jgi:hypothetical protein
VTLAQVFQILPIIMGQLFTFRSTVIASASLMSSDIQVASQQLVAICDAIEDWRTYNLPQAIYQAPIIDWHHPDDYTQKGIAGLRKFQSTVQAERDHVARVSRI